MFGDLLAVVLGPNHQVSAAYQLFWMEWKQMQAAFLIDTTRVKKTATHPTPNAVNIVSLVCKRRGTEPLPLMFIKILMEIVMAIFIASMMSLQSFI